MVYIGYPRKLLYSLLARNVDIKQEVTRLTPLVVASTEIYFLRRRHLAKVQLICVLDVCSNSGVDGEQFSQLTPVQGGTTILWS